MSGRVGRSVSPGTGAEAQRAESGGRQSEGVRSEGGEGARQGEVLRGGHVTPPAPPPLPPRSRGVLALLEENCTSCMLCARECPDWCIHIESHAEPLPGSPGRGRERTRPVLDRFAIDYSLCMYCGICVEVCPFDALFWSPEFEYAEGDVRDLVHERDRLRDWMGTVPAPPATDPAGEPPKELSVASGAAARAGSRGAPVGRGVTRAPRPGGPGPGAAGPRGTSPRPTGPDGPGESR